MNTSNTLQESSQQRVYKNTLATLKFQIQQAENPTPAVVISLEAAGFDNAILLDYLTSEVALEEPEIGSTDPNIPIHNNCMVCELHFGMPRDCGDYEDEGDESDKCGAFRSANRRQRATTKLKTMNLETSDVDGYEGEDGDNVDEEEEALQADDGSMQNVEE
jgi:hypothetical protein